MAKKSNDAADDAAKRPTVYASVDDAVAQAADYFGFAAGENIPVTVDGRVEQFHVPYPGLFTDPQQEAYDALQFEIEQCDRYPGISSPDHKLTHRVIYNAGTSDERIEETEQFVPARTIPGQFITPYQKTDENGVTTRMSPPYNVRLAIALWGEDRYELFRAGGGMSRLISLLQQKMQAQFEERRAADSKSDGSPAAVGEVSEADSDGSS